MVHIKVEDQDACTAPVLGVVRCNGGVIEQAEAHGSSGDGVVAGWPRYAECSARASIQHGVQRRNGGARCFKCAFHRTAAQVGGGVGYAGRHGFGGCLELCQVAGAVRSSYLGGGGWGSARQLERQFNPWHAGKCITNRRHAAVVLGMAGFVVRQ